MPACLLTGLESLRYMFIQTAPTQYSEEPFLCWGREDGEVLLFFRRLRGEVLVECGVDGVSQGEFPGFLRAAFRHGDGGESHQVAGQILEGCAIDALHPPAISRGALHSGGQRERRGTLGFL